MAVAAHRELPPVIRASSTSGQGRFGGVLRLPKAWTGVVAASGATLTCRASASSSAAFSGAACRSVIEVSTIAAGHFASQPVVQVPCLEATSRSRRRFGTGSFHHVGKTPWTSGNRPLENPLMAAQEACGTGAGRGHRDALPRCAVRPRQFCAPGATRLSASITSAR